MRLTSGDRVGPYEIGGALGVGGMGEVYRARDTNLNRDVALKVLPAQVADDPDRLARFRREAQVLASLNHPNIAHIHGLEDAGPTSAFVMELVEGPTLADLLSSVGSGFSRTMAEANGAVGPPKEGRHAPKGLPIDEALAIARQIADALETAHERGIIHRDLKPANIKVRDDGTVKVLDFGLAKALSPETLNESPDAMSSPTLTARATQLGVILGTAAYMAPEQAKGKPVDRRADIWAFGVVVYEMLAGRRGYQAEDVSETLAAVLTREVDWSALPADLPPRLHTLLRDCLVRDPRQRLRDIGDARRVLDQIISGAADPANAVAPTPSTPQARKNNALPWGIAGLAAAAALALAFVHFREELPSPQTVRFQVAAPARSFISGFALSPDGRHLAFATVEGSVFGVQGTSKLWIRSLDSPDTRQWPGTDGLAFAQDQFFWSPDSASIAFNAQRRLKKVRLNGGPAETVLADIAPLMRGTWGRNGVILFLRGPGAPIQRVPDGGGVPVAVTHPGNAPTPTQPQFLPDGRHYFYQVTGAKPETNGVYVASLDDDAPPKRLLADGGAARYAPAGQTGHLLFVRDTTLMAQRFDPRALTLSGQAFPVAESAGRFSVSETGALAYMLGSPPAQRQDLAWMDRNGKQIAVAAPSSEYRDVRLSPDDKSIAFARSEESNTDIWVLDMTRGVPSRITFDPATDNLPIWSPDGQRLVWPSRRSGVFDLYLKTATGAGQDQRFVDMGTTNGWPTDWSSDGKFVMYQRPGEKSGQDLWVAPQGTDASRGAQKPFPYLQSAFNEGNGTFSPDGNWIAYESDESGRPEVYVQTFPLTNQKIRISTAGGTDAAWSKSGAELFYLAANRDLMAVPYRHTATTFAAGVAKALFQIPGNATRRAYAASSDGRRFLVGRPLDDGPAEPMTVVLNWEAGLRK